ncbi:hypothetical protein A3J90_08395 [candidate division WOR-1 bacterium RIFOXYC2_FULL_37_10]|uniref:Uncharacterized protein n=1 Tax=candidate division WOR-1 bacterium RIFOXYB2_FULL_37_13 TaxID=1802579 RepID=A0A1F4SVA0_UNCSA|nr:MAG: hypothetical protein A2310_08165 [candidate division WOR-1 bacterium RIFOXYB2_FULL_37_13]OGC36384.1 MAG: hypothetical protein A3J90_08395 [candidate division WOR-1 bacterium RIFOXYC2_FULL_37_10]
MMDRISSRTKDQIWGLAGIKHIFTETRHQKIIDGALTILVSSQRGRVLCTNLTIRQILEKLRSPVILNSLTAVMPELETLHEDLLLGQMQFKKWAVENVLEKELGER